MPHLCELCHESEADSSVLGLCPRCTRDPRGRAAADKAHASSLFNFGLRKPSMVGASCGQCVNVCRMTEGERGLCGLRANREGKVRPVLQGKALVDWYFDPLPTNCVADWVCRGSRPEAQGRRNMAVFFHGCSFDCLYCQNWMHREGVRELRPQRSLEQMLAAVDDRTFCVCFFGGDPTPQLDFALEASERLRASPHPSRICWETNGSMSPVLARRMAECSSSSGGVVKFDLKALDGNLHYALTGASNRNTLRNFEALARRRLSDEPLQLVASTLLVPGYIDAEEVARIAEFIASIDPAIPYSLLAFHPDYLMIDLPCTTRREAELAYARAKGAGLSNVHLGNAHFLL